MARTETDICQLTATEVVQLFEHYEALIEGMINSNNEMLKRLAKAGLSDQQLAILNEWSLVNVFINEASANKIEMISMPAGAAVN